MKTLLPVLVGVTLALASAAGSAEEIDKDVLKLSIERKSLRDALNDWAQQTGYQLIAEIRGEFVAPKIEGRLTAQEALERLLQGTPLTYQWMGERLVAVKEKSQVVPAALQSISNDMKQPSLPIARFSGEGWSGQRLAANDRAAAREGEPARSERRTSDAEDVEELEEIVVTGTHIRGAEPVGSRVITVSRRDIEATGYATVQDFLKTIPENVGSSNAEVLGGNGNLMGGTGINLRGLGAGATLTLVNGRRLSGSGDFGDFQDIDSIPVGAIERIEILPDGASAVYGSDAIAGVVNIVLRDDYEGAETRMRYASANGSPEKQLSQVFGTSWANGGGLLGAQYYQRNALATAKRPYMTADKTRIGGLDFRSPFSNPGNVTSSDFSMYVAIPSGQDGTALTPGSFTLNDINLEDQTRETDALPQNETTSAFASVHQNVGTGLELSFDGRYSKRDYEARGQAAIDSLIVPSTNPFYVDPAGGTDPVFVDYSFSDDLGPSRQTGTTKNSSLTGELAWQITDSWRLIGAQTYTRETYEFRNGNQLDRTALADALADTDPATAFNPFGDGSHTSEATLNAIRITDTSEGATQTWESTAVIDGPLFALPGGAFKVSAGAGYRRDTLKSNAAAGHKYARQIASGFLEFAAPIVSAANARRGLERLSLSAAVRYDDYDDFGNTTNPRFGLLYTPSQSFSLRGSWGKSFKAPRLTDLDTEFVANGGLSGVLTTLPDLASPSGFSTAFVLGGNNPNLAPETARTWTVGVDVTPPSSGFSASASYYEIQYKDRIVIPGPAGSFFSILFQPEIWSDFITRGPTPAQLADACQSVGAASCPAAAPDVIVDVRLRNLAELDQRGIDLNLEQRLELSEGVAVLWLNGTYVLSDEQRVSRTAEPLDIVDTILNPPSKRARAGVSWSWRNWTVTSAINYKGSYRNNLTSGTIDAWTTVDAGIEFKAVDRSLWWGGVSAALRITNAFDEDPPFANIFSGFDPMNADPLGRLVSVSVSKTW